MTQQVMHAQMEGETGGAEELIPAGAVTFGLEYRTLHGGEEEGVCIHVYGNAIAGDDKELLRFDCFRVAPHYHCRNSTVKKNERLMLDFTAEGDALAWTIDKIKDRLPIMLLRCKADDIARSIDQKDVDAALPKIVAWARNQDPPPGLTGPSQSYCLRRLPSGGLLSFPSLFPSFALDWKGFQVIESSAMVAKAKQEDACHSNIPSRRRCPSTPARPIRRPYAPDTA